MRALGGALASVLGTLLAGCAADAPPPTTVQVGVHRVSFAVPEGFVHYDHGREQRLERTEGDLVITDLGPVTAEGFRRALREARELSRAGRRDDAAAVLRDIRLWRAFADEDDRREATQAEDRIARGISTGETDAAYEALEGLFDRLPPPELPELARDELAGLGHNERRDVEREERLHLDGRDALWISTWQRMTHDLRRRHVFTVNRGNLLVIRTDMGRDEVLGPAFEELVRSFAFAEEAGVTAS
jgi:hypothetical protein